MKSEEPDLGIAPQVRERAHALGISDAELRVLHLLFDPGFYRQRLVEAGEDAAPGMLHYLDWGLPRDIPPGPFFDATFVQSSLGAGDAPLVLRWLRNDSGRPPTPLFDPDFYAASNVAASEGKSPGELFLQFLHGGTSAVECPAPALQRFVGASSRFGVPHPTTNPLVDFLNRVPVSGLPSLADQQTWARWERLFQPQFYSAQMDVSLSGAEAFDHYLAVGIPDGARPNILFNAAYYRTACQDSDGTSRSIVPPPTGIADPFLHWLLIGSAAHIVPTPLFDEALYRKTYADLKQWPRWLFLHYLEHGCMELRRPSEYFDAAHYRKQVPNVRNPVHILDFLLFGGTATPAPGVNVPPPTRDELKTATPLEDLVLTLQSVDAMREEIENDPELRRAMREALRLEPLIAHPGEHGRVQWPPVKHDAVGMVAAGRAIESALPSKQYDNVVLIPHCRIGGASRVAGELVRALYRLYGERPLVVVTDRSEFTRPDWFGGDFDLVDFFDLARASPTPAYSLKDLLTGVRARRVINVNSKTGWNFYDRYGRQMKEYCGLYAYLFTYELRKDGARIGYPIAQFEASFDDLHGVVFDNHALLRELDSRYRFTAHQASKLHVALTPAAFAEADLHAVLAQRRAAGQPLVAIWAGRFDRQKRFDVVIRIAEKMPELTVLAWGRPLLDDDIPLTDLPANIHLMGEFTSLDELSLPDADFFLYTSEWDGLPIVLIDIGARGVSVVSAIAGGTGELVSDDTAWPVAEPTNPEAYVTAIRAALAQPDEAARRAAMLRTKVAHLCNETAYDKALRAMLGDDG